MERPCVVSTAEQLLHHGQGHPVLGADPETVSTGDREGSCEQCIKVIRVTSPVRCIKIGKQPSLLEHPGEDRHSLRGNLIRREPLCGDQNQIAIPENTGLLMGRCNASASEVTVDPGDILPFLLCGKLGEIRHQRLWKRNCIFRGYRVRLGEDILNRGKCRLGIRGRILGIRNRESRPLKCQNQHLRQHTADRHGDMLFPAFQRPEGKQLSTQRQ